MEKSCLLLDRFLDEYGGDGGCDEGPAYWTKAGASLFGCLEIPHLASGQTFSVYENPLIKEIGTYILKVHISGDYYVNFADSPPVLRTVPGNLLYYFGDRANDETLMSFGMQPHKKQSLNTGAGRSPFLEKKRTRYVSKRIFLSFMILSRSN